MNNQQIVALARKIGGYYDQGGRFHMTDAALQTFAAAIAEECARIAKAKAETERSMARSGEISKSDGFICAATATEIEEAIRASFPTPDQQR